MIRTALVTPHARELSTICQAGDGHDSLDDRGGLVGVLGSNAAHLDDFDAARAPSLSLRMRAANSRHSTALTSLPSWSKWSARFSAPSMACQRRRSRSSPIFWPSRQTASMYQARPPPAAAPIRIVIQS